jgi:hypothetical protein
VLAAHQARAKGVAQHLRELVLGERRHGQIEDRARRRGDPEAVARGDVAGGQAGDMQDDAVGRGLAEARRHRLVDAGGHHVAEVVQVGRRLVRHRRPDVAPPVAAPQRPADQVLVLAGREVAQPEEAVVDRRPGPEAALIDLLRVAVARRRRLGGGEVAALPLGHRIEVALEGVPTLTHRTNLHR